MPISAKWKHRSSFHIGFIVFNGGVTTFFAKSVCVQNSFVTKFLANIQMRFFDIIGCCYSYILNSHGI